MQYVVMSVTLSSHQMMLHLIRGHYLTFGSRNDLTRNRRHTRLQRTFP